VFAKHGAILETEQKTGVCCANGRWFMKSHPEITKDRSNKLKLPDLNIFWGGQNIAL